jgi:3-phytase
MNVGKLRTVYAALFACGALAASAVVFGIAGDAEASQPPAVVSVTASVETAPVPDGGDAADDPAIWINPANPAESTIIGTNKRGGLAVYDLAGKQLQYLPDGKMNNVDLREGFPLGGKSVALVVAGNRTDNTLAVYRVDPSTRRLEPAGARAIRVADVYGFGMYHSSKTGKFYALVTSKKGLFEQWELFDNGAGKVDGKLARSLKFSSTIEGFVADDELGHLYIGEEATGIWKLGAEPDTGDARKLIDKTGGGRLVPDVEGLAIAYGASGTGYLMVSSQGNATFVVYERGGDNAYVKTFKVDDGDRVDGVAETDGIDVTTAPLGERFPRGVFVAQDGFNDSGNQNFKLVPLERILGER